MQPSATRLLMHSFYVFLGYPSGMFKHPNVAFESLILLLWVGVAGTLLGSRHAAERLLNCWHGGDQTVGLVRDAMKVGLTQDMVLFLIHVDLPYTLGEYLCKMSSSLRRTLGLTLLPESSSASFLGAKLMIS